MNVDRHNKDNFIHTVLTMTIWKMLQQLLPSNQINSYQHNKLKRATISQPGSYKLKSSYSRKGLLIEEEDSSDLRYNNIHDLSYTSVSIVVLIILVLLSTTWQKCPIIKNPAARTTHPCVY